MGRVTIRVSDEMKRRMDREGEVNWSEYIRKSIRERLEYPKAPRKIQKLVDGYRDDMRRLWILHMFSQNLSRRFVYETAELLFGEDLDGMVDEVEAELEKRGLNKMHEELENGLKIGETIKASIASQEGFKIKERVREAVKNAPGEVRDGILLLSYYVENRLDRDVAHVVPRGLERTWEIYVGKEVEIDDLISTGIMYKSFYSSNAYSHWFHKVPDYALDLLGGLIDGSERLRIYRSPPSKSTFKNLLNDKLGEFLKWMKGARKYVTEFNEEEEIEEALEENNLKLELKEFEELRTKLVKKNVLILDFSPHRSSTGGRSSMPAKWIYRFTHPALDLMPEIMLEKI